MTTQNATMTTNLQHYTSTCPTTIPWDNINEPGTYICNWSGHLMRVPEDGIAPGRSPVVNMSGYEPLFVTKISNDPYIPVTKARLLASNFDLKVNF